MPGELRQYAVDGEQLTVAVGDDGALSMQVLQRSRFRFTIRSECMLLTLANITVCFLFFLLLLLFFHEKE